MLKKLKNGEARIPIRRGLDFSYALENFIDIVNFHKRSSNKYLDKNLGGKLDVDDLNLDQNMTMSSTDSQTVDRLTNDIDKAVAQLDFEKAARFRWR